MSVQPSRPSAADGEIATPSGNVTVASFKGGGDGTDPLRRSRIGTMYYLSPEQVRGEQIIDTRSDVYSLGVVLYEMLAQRPPFDGSSMIDILAAIVEKKPVPLPQTVPLGLHGIVERAMRKDIYERTQTAFLLLDELSELRLQMVIRAREQSTLRAVAT